ncbi:MAG TPA: DUF192 domain-containing protein [Ignavibacteria bacterium]|nr:DUF192 domain-containing protein [Ignavibacteria bacterium]
MKEKSSIIIVILFLFVYSSCNKHEDVKIDTLNQQDANKTKFTKMGEVYFQDSLKNLKSKIDAEIAETDESRHIGLMFREGMKEDQGMLFIFPSEELQGFYMRNTLMPLDIIFINSKKQIVKIHKNTTPLSEKSLPSLKPSIYVVEVIAGYTDKFGIKEGYFIDWRRN